MGYTTVFSGHLSFQEQPSKELVDYVNRFRSTRRMRRNPDIIKQIDPNWEKHCFQGNLGPEGAYYTQPDVFPVEFVKNVANSTSPQIRDFAGQIDDISVVQYNFPPQGQPGLWCRWCICPNADGEQCLAWDGSEKFYNYDLWLKYLIQHFFIPTGHVLNGQIVWQGEDKDDYGIIHVTNNVAFLEYQEKPKI